MSFDPAEPVVLPLTIIDVGLQKRRRIEKLADSTGTLSRQIAALVERICDHVTPDDRRDVIPIVLLYECAEEPPCEMRMLPSAAGCEAGDETAGGGA